MKLEIQDAISSLVPPEQLSIILDVVDTLLEKDYVLALDELNTVLMLADDNCDSAMLVARIHDVLVYAMNYCLNDYDIIISDDAPLYVRHAVYKTLIYMPLYLIPESLAHIFEADYDNEETIAQLVPYFTEYSVEQILPFVESVSGEILNTLRGEVDAKMAVQAEYVGKRRPTERIRVINQLIQRNGRDAFSMMIELSDAGVNVGRSYEELINISFEALESKNPEDVARQLVGLAFFSDVELGAIWRTIDASLDDYTDNPLERRIMLDAIGSIKRSMGDINETT